MVQIWRSRWDWFHRPIHTVAHLLHPLYKDASKWSDHVLAEGWAKYIQRVYDANIQNKLEDDVLDFKYFRGFFARHIAQMRDNHLAPISWWEKFGNMNEELQHLALRVLSQDCTTGASERVWSICGDIHTKKRNRLSTKQLDRLVYVNANLRLLEKCRGPDGLGVLVWKPIQVNPDDISMEPGDISHLQPHTSEDDVYDFLREEVMIRRRNTRSMTRRCNASQGVATVVEASTEPVQRGGRGTLAYSRRSRAQRGKARMNEVPSPHQSQENESSESEAGTSSSEDSTNVDGWFADETGSSSSSRSSARSNGGFADEDNRD